MLAMGTIGSRGASSMKSRNVRIWGVTVVCLCAATLVGRAASQGGDEGAQSSQSSARAQLTQQTQPPEGPPPGPLPRPRGAGPMGGGPGGPGGPMGMPFGGGLGGPMMPGGAEVVAGAPYSAQAITEITQTLPDGNRIVRKVT